MAGIRMTAVGQLAVGGGPERRGCPNRAYTTNRTSLTADALPKGLQGKLTGTPNDMVDMVVAALADAAVGVFSVGGGLGGHLELSQPAVAIRGLLPLTRRLPR